MSRIVEGFCMDCIERAEKEVAAGHYYSAAETFAALREGRNPVCKCGRTHPNGDGIWQLVRTKECT